MSNEVAVQPVQLVVLDSRECRYCNFPERVNMHCGWCGQKRTYTLQEETETITMNQIDRQSEDLARYWPQLTDGERRLCLLVMRLLIRERRESLDDGADPERDAANGQDPQG